MTGFWKELGRTTLGVAGDTISVSGLPNKRYYMTLSHIIPSGSTNATTRFNNDSATNYAVRGSANGGADSTVPSATHAHGTFTSAWTTQVFGIGYINNISTQEKLTQFWDIWQNTVGAGTVPQRQEVVGKWANTTNEINRIDWVNTQTGDYASGSEVVVLGWDPADTHTDNFWEELATTTTVTSSEYLETSFTAKKYLWVQCHWIGSGNNSGNVRMGNGTIDIGSNYAYRQSVNGGADLTDINQTRIYTGGAVTTGEIYHSFFIINVSANEKLVIGHVANNDVVGAGTAPTRNEFVGKWINTTNQANIIRVGDEFETGTITSGRLTVWGHD